MGGVAELVLLVVWNFTLGRKGDCLKARTLSQFKIELCYIYLVGVLPIIDDLSRSAMRPRHWKQLLRVTGGTVQISNEGLTRMTLGQLLELGLHSKF